MATARDLENCCSYVESTKIKVRKQGYDQLNELLHQKATIEFLTEHNDWWDRISSSIHNSLAKEHDKNLEDYRKKGVGVIATPQSADLLALFLRIAAKNNATLNFRKSLILIIEILNDRQKDYLQDILLKIVSGSFLTSAYISSLLKWSDWDTLYLALKVLIETKTNCDVEQIKCLLMVIKWGPLYKFPVNLLREEFDFVAKLCQMVGPTSPKLQQELVLELLFEFYRHTTKDNRMACCKLGEKIFWNLVDLYQSNANEDKMKANLIRFFYLQVIIHHPKGVQGNHQAAYAFKWDLWTKCLHKLYDILTCEIDKSLESTFKTHSFFIEKNGTKELLEDVVCLFVEVFRQMLSTEIRLEERPRKRPRIEVSVTNLIQKIKETQSWTWINLTYVLIESYPEIITSEEYITLLQDLISLQVDSKNQTLLYHFNKALIVLQNIESMLDLTSHQTQLDILWGGVADSTLRLMNQDGEVQTLLQQLIVRKYITSHESLFQNYKSGSALKISEANLKTLDVAFKKFAYLQYDSNLKEEIISWILKGSSKLYCHSQVAEFLVSLILKQWESHTCDLVQKKRSLKDIEDIYLSVSFQNLVICEENPKKKQNNFFCVDTKLLNILLDLLINLMNNLDAKNQIADLLNITVLVFNVISYLIKYKLVDSNEIINLNVYAVFEKCAKSLFSNLKISVEQNERNMNTIINYLNTLNILFKSKISEFMSKQLRTLIPEELLREMFVGLQTEFEDSFLTFKKSLMETLVSFSCLPDCSELLLNQKRAMEVLLSTEYDYTSDNDYALVLTLLHTIASCAPKNMPEDSLLFIFNIFQSVCEVHYYCYISAVEILDLLYEIYPFINCSCRSQFVEMLYPFYCKRLNYGPNVSISLLKCMCLIYELDPSCNYLRWSNEEIVLKMPEFLKSDYQDVRFCAMRTIAKFFRISGKIHLLEHYHRQEIMFSKIHEMSLQVLQIEGQVNLERKIDETVTRCSSILHTFASIMVTSHVWIEESLYTMLKIVCDKNFDISQVETIIEMVAQKLGFKSGLKLLEKYLVPLVNRWKSDNFEQFPFRLFKCNSSIRFYTKYWPLLAHIFVDSQLNSVNQIASNFGESLQKLIEDTCPKLLSYCIGQEISNLSSVVNNKIYQLLSDTLGEDKLREVFKSNIEEIILCLTDFISDETSFENSFQQNIIFPKSCEIRITVGEFHNCLQFIESTLYNQKSVIVHLMQNHPEKNHFILLQLNLRITTALALEEKLRYFHLYSIISSLLVDNIEKEPSLQIYLIRDLTHNLLHHIKAYKTQLELSEISCKFFKIFLKKILPNMAKVLAQFFLVIISRLKNIALENCPISHLCIDMLQFLIVDHKDYFLPEIEKLDSIPRTPEFNIIYAVHYEVKYGNRKVTLQDEIVQFLDFSKNIESLDECEQSLTHLRILLTERKDELRSIYSELRETRGFSEDCENSNLHKLICVLITLSCSSNKSLNTEAMRCLGEIGPSDLATLILQPEKAIPDSKWTPWELVLGYAVSLLSKYIIDSDVQVIKVASLALFQILSTKEGRKVAESETDYGFGPIDCSYLAPFCAISMRRTNFNVNVNGDVFVETIRTEDLWIPGHNCHETWIMKLVCGFLGTFQEKEICAAFIEVCKVKTEFCEQIFPLIINTVLDLNIFAVTNLISTKIKSFFDQHWYITVNNDSGTNITTNKSSVQTMLNVVHFVRLQRSVRKKEITDLSLNYLKVAKAAHFCTAHFTALLYAELWCQEQVNQSPNDYALSTSTYTKLDLIYEKVDEITGSALQNILRQAYKAVGEVDAFLGCGTSHLLNPTCRVEHYKELGRWDQVMHHYELEISLGNSCLSPLVNCLNKANLYQLSLFCSNALDEPNYESLWRLGHWEYTKRSKSDLSYDKSKFYTLKALSDNDEFSFFKSLDEARGCVVKDFMGANMESIKNFYHTFAKLQCLKEIEDFTEALKNDEIVDVLAKWKTQDGMILNDFQYVEPVHAQRIVLLTDFLKKTQSERENLREVIMDAILTYAESARLEGCSNIAFRILRNLRLIPSSNDVASKIQLEEAQLCWSIQDILTAKCILRQLCTNENVNPRLHAVALKMTGKLMVESSSENRQTIIENYFQKSLKLLKNNVEKTADDQKSILDTFNQLAKFADHEYQEVVSHIKSGIFQKKKENIIKAKEAVRDINLNKAPKDLRKAVAIKKKQSTMDEIEINSIETDKDNLLQLALRYYLLNLIGSDDHNMEIFRLISLLLENRTNELVKPVLEKDLLKIPTYKFINILPQIIPHISTSTSDLFNQTVNNVIERCANDHPYHTLPLILSLALSNKDRDYAESKAAVNDARMQSARTILTRLKREDKLKSLIEKMEFLSEAVIEFAYIKSNGEDDGKFKVPRKCKIRKVENYDDVLVPTYNLPVKKSGDYNRIVGIRSFRESFHNVGGINAPKRVACKCTDGITRSQLIKGQDDLRQDAVMQQVFTIMNSLLQLNKQTKNLLIRTYKIVPLSMRSGILEWVENTIPIGEYLTGDGGDGGAHVKFRPMDKTPRKCRDNYKNAASTKSNEEKLRIFNKICQNIKPVFHKFVETTFPQPTVWYERRRAYIHSVATTSMCGYILGIGDRHVNNILIDKNTAEVVHIDFGIAFEQGKVLPTPETVPFRLSRDIVDGMGVSGVEGVFRRSCEKTVEVLRLHYQTIITILEVLLYDPLYDWTVSSAEANKRQKDEEDCDLSMSVSGGNESPSEDVNVTAERALLRLRAKLLGTESGKATTVEHQVGTLIQQAVDPSNLSRLYQGWQPYL